MNELVVFQINEKDCLKVLVPDFEYKENYYYKPVKELQMFDVVTVEYQTNKTGLILKKDHVNEVFTGIRNNLEALLKGELALQKNIRLGMLGYQWNIDTDKDNFDVDYFVYWLFSYRGVQTWIYNKDSKMYLEISPSYPWHSIEPSENEKVVSFEKFMQQYKPQAVYELTEKTVQKWIHEADLILEKMIKVKK